MTENPQRLIPTAEEIHKWMMTVVRHASHIEYFLEHLQIGAEDPDRPHDIVGEHNKLEWDVLSGLALQFRDCGAEIMEKVIVPQYVLPAVNLHRNQYHHRIWNESLGEGRPDAMKLGAVDAVCSRLESTGRGYQGGHHSYDQITAVAHENPPRKANWMLEVIPEMQKIEKPRLNLITSLDRFPNIGISTHAYDTICGRVRDTLHELEHERGYKIPRRILASA